MVLQKECLKCICTPTHNLISFKKQANKPIWHQNCCVNGSYVSGAKMMNSLLNNTFKVKAPSEIIDLQLKGEFQAAHDAYIDHFQENDIDYNLLSMFAVCCLELGKAEKAEKIFGTIIEQCPLLVEPFLHLTHIYLSTNRYQEAIDLLSGEAAEKFNDPRITKLLADLLSQEGKFELAASKLRDYLNDAPNDNKSALSLSKLEFAMGNLDSSKELIETILFEEPSNQEALEMQAQILFTEGNVDAALTTITGVTETNPRNASAGLLRCKLLDSIGAKKELLKESERLATLDPDDKETLCLLMNAQSSLGRHASSIYTAQHLLNIDPKNASVLGVLSGGYFAIGQYEKALEVIDRILKIHPKDSRTLSSKGVCLERLFHIDEALEAFDAALQADPSDSLIKFNKSLTLLTMGRFREGFELYENRFEKDRTKLARYVGAEPEWTGSQSIRNRHLLIHPEQGYGDTIMASRFVPFLDQEGAKVTFAVPRALKTVMQTLDANCEVVAVGDIVENIDYQCSLMSLAHYTSHRWDALPSHESYLTAPATEDTEQKFHFNDQDRFRVGLVCSGNPNHKNDLNRSINMFEVLKALPEGPEYHLLQKDFRNTDEAAVKLRPDVIRHDNEISSFADTASLIDAMDVVVSVDTSVAHLAGALGKNLIVLVPFCGDWRWGMDRTKSTWYPSAQIIRQTKPGDWRWALSNLALILVNQMTQKLRAR